MSRSTRRNSNALLSDVEARAERRRTRTSAEMWEGLARQAWERGKQERENGDLAAARRWLERARRLAPEDGLVRFTLATVLLESGAAQHAAPLFETLGNAYNLPDAWAGLAACRLQTGDPGAARDAIEAALRCSVPTPTLRALAAAVVTSLGLPGWCGLDSDGRLHTGPGRASRITLDGAPVRSKLPRHWRSSSTLEVAGRAGPFLGSPIPVRAIAAVEGFVETHEGGLRGWAWYPADRDRVPLVLIGGGALSAGLRPQQPVTLPPGGNPLARPLGFELDRVAAEAMRGPFSVTLDGRHLFGSPLDPGIEARMDGRFSPVWADVIGGPPRVAADRPPVQIVIPVYRGLDETIACIASVLAAVPAGTVVHVIDDASPEPDLAAAVQELAATGRISLTRLAENRGFPGAANTGIRAAPGHDVVLLNSDTIVAPGWLERLRAAAYAAPEIGTATPLSNDATVVSYPDPNWGNPVPDRDATLRLDRLAQQANAGQVADLPVGVGFCLYLRRDCLDQTGLFREDLFAQGYGEENDLCLRARHHGWRHVAALDVFVAHVGGRSFGAARNHLIARNTAILNRLHPGYDALVSAHLDADPLHPARRRMDALRWAEGRARKGAALLVTHAGGGGVDQVVSARCDALAAEGLRPIVLRPAKGGCRVDGFPNLTFTLPAELPDLAALLRADRPRHIELHHLLGHDHAILGLAGRLKIPLDAWIHDYASFCPRIALVSRNRRYCGEPDVAGCEACIADLGGLLEEEIPVPDLLARSAADLAACRRVVTPSRDAAARIRRHFPHITPEVRPWEDDRALPPLAPARSGPTARICIVGAIGVEKGFEVLLDCVRDAARRKLPLEFVVCGFTADDERLLAAGPVFVTGEYRDTEAIELIRAQRAHLAFIPSVWPETWCFALSRAWQAGLPAAVFDLGAQAERVAATGRGWTLPLGLPPAAVNDALLRLASLALPSQCPPRQRQPF